MSILEELNTLISPLLLVETGVFSDTAPERYAVITPLGDTFGLYGDDKPGHEIQEARISIYDKGNYTTIKNRIVRIFLDADICVTDRRYVGHEDNTGYHHYAIDVAKNYELEE